MNFQYYMGVDPGLSGGIAVLDSEGDLVYLRDMPTRKDVSKNTVDILALRDDEDFMKIILSGSICCTLERVGSMPGQGVASTFSFGKGTGKIEGALEAFGIMPTLVVPTVWKKRFSLLKQDKKVAVYKARELWPDQVNFIVSKDGRADAALIAKYGMMEWENKDE